MRQHQVLGTVLIVLAAMLTACGVREEVPNQPPAPSGENAPATSGDSADTRGITVVEQLAAGDLSSVTTMFDATMTAVLPEASLKQTWDTLIAQFGAYQSHGDARVTSEQGYTAVYVPCTFERGTLNAKIVMDGDNKIAGLFFQP